MRKIKRKKVEFLNNVEKARQLIRDQIKFEQANYAQESVIAELDNILWAIDEFIYKEVEK